MRLAGLQKLTLLDYPGEVACTVFTQGCNLRCPFCQNPELVLPELFSGGSASDGGLLPEDVFFDFLERRRGKLSGVVVSGGEPTLHRDLPAFLHRIRRMGYLVKLDTNGLNPEMLSEILHASLVDYVAVDVKNSPAKYALTCGYPSEDSAAAVQGPAGQVHAGQAGSSGYAEGEKKTGTDLWQRVCESIALLMESPVMCEFRTTVALGLHTEEDIVEMAEQLPGGRPWYLQQFRDSGNLIGTYRSPELVLRTPSPEELERMRKLAAGVHPDVSVRGV